MKRAGFTMIELIFVIVILGILSAVALPKFIGVSEQAKAGKCKAFVGTLNRTVGPALWSQSIMDDNNGSLLSEFGSDSGIHDELVKQIDIPAECETSDSATSYGKNDTVTIGTQIYDVNFTDGNTTTAPTWTWTKAP
ncbi:type II secretion system protein [Sulfurimonas sp.]